MKKPRSTRRKYCTYRLRDQNVREEFVIALANRYDALYNGLDDEEEAVQDVEQEWSKVKEMYIHLRGSTWQDQEREEGMDERRHLETC